MLSPDGGEGADTPDGLDVANHTDNDHGRGLNDGDSLCDFFLVGLGARLLHITHNVGHASLESHKGSQVRSLGGVIARE